MPKISRVIQREEKRQKGVINLIPSENYASGDVLVALGSVFTNKYAEGKVGQRYYFGNKYADEMEAETKRLLYLAFGISPEKYGVNVQPYSGSIANLAAYFGTLELGDKILAMSLEHGGHLTHGHKASATSKLFKFQHYGVGRDGFIDYGEVLRLAKKFKPRMIIAGGSAYPRIIDFKKFRQIATTVDALLMADIAHIAGLIVGGAHPSPFPCADIVTSTTQKTLRGPRGAFVISRRELSEKIDKAVFPGLQGGPHLHTIAAIGACLEEAIRPSFRKYANQVVKNAKVLAGELKRLGFELISGGTDNHLMLVNVTPLGLTGKTAGEKLEKAGIIVNKNVIPFDVRKPWDPSGIRLGTAAATTQGMKEKEMAKIAEKIHRVLTSKI